MKKALRADFILTLACIVMVTGSFTAVEVQAASQIMDYFTATPIIGSLSSTCWGAAQVGPRDQSNGLEDKTLANWVYWDGGIIKASDGTYHMFAARWNQADGHSGWQYDSHVVHATSSNLYGPYTDQGLAFTDNSGLGHNVNILQLKTGDSTGKQYAITLSGGVPGSGRVYGANSLNGPWTYLGNVTVASGSDFNTNNNLQVILRPDGKYEAIESRGIVAISDKLLGPYVAQGPSIWANGFPSIPNKNDLEDPTIWYSGGKYHFVTNEWDIVKAFSFTSSDGKSNWRLDSGHAYDAAANFIRYTNGTVNHWAHIERPRPYMENGHVVAFTFAAINVEKANDLGNDQNGSKVIVVPFNGAALDSGTVGTVYTGKKSPYIVNNTIMIPGLGAFKADDAPDVERVQFTDLLGKKVLEMPIESGKAIERCNLPHGLYLMNFYGKERIESRSYNVLVK
ncbi:MAG: glycoside hydrolase family protein [Chitinispirillaceae bacterium]|jgi:hypothetical protein